jgi:bacillolysin
MFDPATGDGVVETHDAGGTPDIEPTPANLVTWTGATVPANLIGDGAVDAHWAAGMVFEWYQAHLGRNSIDDQGMSIVSVANAADPGTGEPMVNAFWDGTKMVYGNPGRGLYPFSASLDVVAHELTHGVTQFSVDPDLSLVYIHQSGAINEATSDYFGNAFQDDTEGITPDDGSWGQLGEDLCVDPTTNGYNVPCPLRDVSDPNAVGLPASTSEYLGLLPDLDNGGVHLDSTIYSSTLWQIRTEMYEAHGGAPGALLADRIVYGAYQYYTPTTDFLAGRAAVTQSAMDLQAQGVLSAADVQVVESAFDDHGIVDGWDADPAGRDSTILVDNDIPLYFFGVNGPRASGHRFVYGDYEDKSSFCCRRQQIYVANTDGSGGPAEIGDTASPATITDDGQPVISGRQIAWTHGVLTPQGVSSRIEGRKLGGPVQTLARAPGSLLLDPALSGRRLAWTRISFPGGGFAEDVYTRRLGGKTVKLSTSGFAAFPATNGRWVTWLDGTARGPAIMAADTRTGRVRTLQQPANATVGPPAINGSTLVFFSDVDSDGTGAIMRWPLGSRQVTKLVSYSDAGDQPDQRRLRERADLGTVGPRVRAERFGEPR